MKRLAALLLFATTAFAGETVTLDHAVRLALAHSAEVQNARLEVERAETRVLAARTQRLPSFSVEMIGGEALNNLSIEVAETNTRVELGRTFSMIGIARVTQPLTQLHAIGLGVRMNEAALAVDRERERAARMAVAREVKSAYFAVLSARAYAEAMGETVAAWEEVEREMNVRVSQQAALEADRMDASAKLAATKLAALQAANALASAKDRLAYLVGREVDVVPVERQALSLSAGRAESPPLHGNDRRPDVREAALRVEQAQLDLRLKQADRIPEVALMVSNAMPFNNDALPNHMTSAGISMSYEPFTWGRRKAEITGQAAGGRAGRERAAPGHQDEVPGAGRASGRDVRRQRLAGPGRRARAGGDLRLLDRAGRLRESNRRGIMKRTINVIVISALALAACAKHEISQPEVTAVEVAPVREIAGSGGLRYSATVEPDAQVAVAFRVSGYVEAVAAEEGDRVSKGTVLARIRTGDYAEKLGQASASQAEAQAALEQARADLARARTLFAANALTKPELDAAAAAVEIGQARVSRGRAAAGEANLALRDTALVAPIDGVILSRNVEQGDLGTPGAVAFVLADTRTVRVMFGAPDTMIRSLRLGQTVDVSTESMPDRLFSGTVARIAPAADPKTRSFDVELHIDNSANELKPGMVASLEIARGSAAQLAIPLDAVIRPKTGGGQAILPVPAVPGQAGLPVLHSEYAVYVVEDGKARARGVELGEPMGNLVALRGGLQKDERVVVSGPALLVDGQAVRVVSGGTYARQ